MGWLGGVAWLWTERSGCAFIVARRQTAARNAPRSNLRRLTWLVPRIELVANWTLQPPHALATKRTRQASLYRIAAANRSISFSFAPSTLRTVCAKAPDASASHVAQASSMHSSFRM